MSALNVSTINTSIIDTVASGILRIGPTNVTSINIGKTAVPVNMSILNVSTINTSIIDTVASGILSIGTTNATRINIGKTAVPVNMSILNASSINTSGLTITGPNYITLGEGSSPSSSQLGWIVSSTISGPTYNVATTTLTSITIPFDGVYIFNIYFRFSWVASTNPVAQITIGGSGSQNSVMDVSSLLSINNGVTNTGCLSATVFINATASDYNASIKTTQILSSASGYLKAIRVG
jgi:hypothetical protein